MRDQVEFRVWRAAGRVAAALALLAGTGCSTLSSIKDTFIGGPAQGSEPARLAGFIGAAVADEPRAALAGREILALGGSAADAAVAVGFMLAVTLPSRAGLGGGGACLALNPAKAGPNAGNAEAFVFPPVAPARAAPQTDRPAAIPMLPRGLFALHARYGRLPFEQLISPAEQSARFGVSVSRALLADLSVVSGPLLQDPQARAVFGPGGRPLSEGGMLVQPDLAATLAQLRTAGVGDLYVGVLARRLADASRAAGGGLIAEQMRDALPQVGAPITLSAGRDFVAFLPPRADGGLGAAAAFQVLQAGGGAAAAQGRAADVVMRSRQAGGDPMALLASSGGGGGLPALPASAAWITLDRDGNSVACTVTMDNLFGTGRIAPGTGILLAAVPGPAPLLAASIAWNTNLRAFRAAVTGTGQEGAALAAAVAMNNALAGRGPMPQAVPEPGRADVITCGKYLPDNDGSCSWAVDPRSTGLAAGGN